MHTQLQLAKLLLLLVNLTLFSSANAQSYSSVTDLEEYRLELQVWTKGDGIPDWYVEGVFQDSRGMLWIAWKGRLCRFDGKSIKTVLEEPRGHYEFVATYLGEDRLGNIWKLSAREGSKGIEVYNPFTETFTSMEAYLGKEAGQLPADIDFRQWALYSFHEIIYLYHRDDGQMWKFDGHWEQICAGRKEEIVGAQFIPAPGKGVWSISGQDGVRLLDQQGQTVKHFPELRWLDPRHPDLWWPLDTAPEVELLLTEDFRLQQRLSEEEVRCLYTDQRLDKRRSARTVFQPYQLQNYLSRQERLPGGYSSLQLDFNGINKVDLINLERQDRTNLLQVINEAISKFNLSVGKAPDFLCGYAWPIVLKDGSILWFPPGRAAILIAQIKPVHFQSTERDKRFYWMSARGEKLYTLAKPGAEVSAYALDNFAKERLVPSLFPINCLSTQADHLWYGDSGKFGKISYAPPHTSQLITAGQGGVEEDYHHIYDLLFLPDSLLWVASDLRAYELDLKSLERRPLIDSTAVNAFYRDRGGRVWAGTEQGVYSFSEHRYYLNALPEIGALDVVHFYEQSPDTYWLATRQGLIRWEPGSDRYKRFTTEDGLSDNIIHAVYPDKHGRLWMSTNYGISAFLPADSTFQSFYIEDGLSHNEQNFRAHAQDESGRLYFGSLAGINYFDPNDIPLPQNQMGYDLFANYMRLYDGEGMILREQAIVLNETAPYALPRSCKRLSIKFSLPNYQTRRLSIEWQIANTGGQWQALGSDREFFMPNVPFGDLHLAFRVRNSDTHQIMGTYQLHFEVQKPILYSLFFWLIAGLALSTIAALIWLWRLRAFRIRNKELQRAIDEQTFDLQEKTKKLEKLDAAKSELFSNISHELRTPLTLIHLEAERILKGGMPDKLEQQTGAIQQQVKRMTALLDDILQLNKAKMGLIRAEYKPVEWNQFLQRTFGMFSSLAEKKGIDYKLKILQQDAQYLQLEKGKLEHILQNLISNAIKFTPAGGRILVRSTLKGSEVEVVVSDTGPGIAADEQEMIFERYYQAGTSRDPSAPGYGIGLALCREYAHLIDGHIWVESELGKGASFFLTFPMVAAEKMEAKIHEPSRPNTAAPVRTFDKVLTTGEPKPGILVVEDNPALLQLLNEILSEEYEVGLAANGEEALQLLKASPERFKVVISDIMMPVVDGYSLLNSVRSHPKLGFTPFIFISALKSTDELLKAYRLGVDGFIRKPFESIELKTRVRNLIKNQELRHSHLKGAEPAPLDTAVAAEEASEENAESESYDEAWLNDLEAIVRKHLSREDLKIGDIAYQLHISERTLRNYIKAYTGLTPTGYLQKARLDQAHLLLLKRKYKTVGEVAYAVGFKDAQYFSKLFKKEFGRSPSDLY